jgi:hypothetical protein
MHLLFLLGGNGLLGRRKNEAQRFRAHCLIIPHRTTVLDSRTRKINLSISSQITPIKIIPRMTVSV